MPSVFLSPSTQEGNPYINGGTEEYYMNLVADAMEPYLRASGISFGRNSPTQTLSQAIARSNAGNYDLHLAIHSNAAGSANSGRVRGTDVYYYPTSVKGKRAADIIAENFKDIYPLPEKPRRRRVDSGEHRGDRQEPRHEHGAVPRSAVRRYQISPARAKKPGSTYKI